MENTPPEAICNPRPRVEGFKFIHCQYTLAI